jgi:hypothetical protein
VDASPAAEELFGGIPRSFTGADHERGELKRPDGHDRCSRPDRNQFAALFLVHGPPPK